MAAVEVCDVAWLAWGVVVGLLGMVWAGLGKIGDDVAMFCTVDN